MIKKRNSSLDCLRCLCMFFVVIIHVLGHSGFLENLTDYNLLYYLTNLILSCIRVAVPVFVLITGYFGTTLKSKKVIGFEITLLFYSFLSLILALAINHGQIELDMMSVLKTVLPFTYKSWWFATMYLVLVIFSPFINRLLESITQKEHLLLLLICFVLFNVVSSFSLDPIETTNGYGFVNFIFLYCIGRYIRKYGILNRSKWLFLTSYLVCSFAILLTYRVYGNYKFGTYNSVLLLLSAISLFMFFEKTNLKTAFWSKISPYTFAVYLISDNFFLRQIVNKQFFNPNDYISSAWVLVFIFIYAFIVMVVCMLIDWCVKKIFGKFKIKVVNFLDHYVSKSAHTILDKLIKANGNN